MLKALEDLIYYLIENWRSLTIQGALTAVVLIIVKRIGIRQLKKLLHLKENAEMERIELKVDLLLKERGIEWSSPPNGLKPAKIPHIKNYFSYSRQEIKSASQLRRMKRMINNFLSGKKKMLTFVLLVLVNGLNDTLGLNLSHETIVSISSLGGGYIIVEGIIDIVRALVNKKGGTPNEPTQHTIGGGPAV